MAAGVVLDPFAALGLPRDATSARIKAQYHALARKYHPNRHQRPDDDDDDPSKAAATTTPTTPSEHFHNVHQAWKLLSRPDNRRRRLELLNLLDVQNDLLAHFADLMMHPGSPAHEADDHDGHISSDADDHLPNVGLQRRQTFANRNNTHVAHLGDQADITSPTSPTKKQLKLLARLGKGRETTGNNNNNKSADYFTLRKNKLAKLRRKELEAFTVYRNAMARKFEAEEEAERHQEHYERAKWKREYFERAPRGTTERFRSFQQFIQSVTAFGSHTPTRQRGCSNPSYNVMTPVLAPGESQFLLPDSGLARQMTMHRRGWSSDISGDQSSSGDDSGEAYGWRRTPPLPAWHRRGRRADDDSNTFDAFAGSGMRETAGSSQVENLMQPPTGLKVIVRQPTDLASIQEAQDSSGDTLSNSSRTPSPQPHSTGMELTGYMWLPSSSTSEVFGLFSDQRARSSSPAGHQRQISFPRTDRETCKSISEGLQFTTKQLGVPHHRNVPMEHVYELDRLETSRMLGVGADSDDDPEALLDRLQVLDPSVASKFMVKPDIKELFRFRLIYGHENIATKQRQSFIALSYRRKLHVTKDRHHFTLPLEPEIFQAVWEERQSDHEGVWIDQICIDQESREETTISMSAMDMVYRSARLVVVALDDIELNAYEGELLQNHMSEYNGMTHVPPAQRFRRKQPPYLESHDNLYSVIRKILRSSWFKRAWCRHEMRLARHHIFLIPCKRPGTWSGRDVLRFNGKCISHLLDLSTEVPFESDVETVKPALHAFFRDRSKTSPDERGPQSHHGNFSTVVAEVFAMEAGGDPRIPIEQREADARKDKIAIILNTMECGLAISDKFRDPNIHLSQHECFHDLMLLSLAALDPGALCSVGPPLPITDKTHSWVYSPTVADSGLNNSKTLQRLPHKARMAVSTSGQEHFIRLDLNFLKSGRRDCNPLDPEALKLARHFIGVCDERQWGRNRKRYLTHDRKANLLFGPMEEVYAETLACVFSCGPDWMRDVCQRYSMSRWRVDLQGAYELLIALQNTCGRWPADAWNERAAGFVLDFANFLVLRGLPQRQILKPERWRPVHVPTANGGKIVTFVPVGNRHVRPAIPTVLINPDYVHLARLWILQPRPLPSDEEDLEIIPNVSDWTLLGKSVIFSDELSIAHMTSFGAFLKERQNVYGRHRQPTSSNGVFQGVLTRS